MSRINTNVSSLIAQRVLRKNNNELSTSLQRLSTGLKINTGADNPAGLIASENLRSEKVGITQAIDNAGRANNIIGTAEGGLSEVSNLLTELQSLVSYTRGGDDMVRRDSPTGLTRRAALGAGAAGALVAALGNAQRSAWAAAPSARAARRSAPPARHAAAPGGGNRGVIGEPPRPGRGRRRRARGARG